jgi:hypothetical protein
MPDEATQVTKIQASPQRCFEAAVDFERYPDWATDIKEVSVLERDEQGRGVLVQFRAAAFGRSTSYSLRYDYAEAPQRLSWIQVDGDLTNKLDGVYEFAETPGRGDTDGLATEATYHLMAELRLPIPGFVKRRAEGRIIHTALRDLKRWVEASSR